MTGRITWIGVRPQRKGPVTSIESVEANIATGLTGDHATKEHRQVTLISVEALDEVARDLGQDSVDPAQTRRNIVISGLDFTRLENTVLDIGEARIEITGICHPCRLMNQNIGDGARQAMKGYRGGYTARILRTGKISVGDRVVVRERTSTESQSSISKSQFSNPK